MASKRRQAAPTEEVDADNELLFMSDVKKHVEASRQLVSEGAKPGSKPGTQLSAQTAGAASAPGQQLSHVEPTVSLPLQ